MAQYQSRHADPARPKALLDRASPSPRCELHPDLAAPARHRRRRRRASCARRRGARRVPRAGHASTIRARHRVRAVPLGRRVGRQRADQPGARPALADARVQGLRGRRRASAPRRACTARPPTLLRHRTSQPPTSTKDLPMPHSTASCRASSRSRARGWTSPPRSHPALTYIVPDGRDRPGALLPRRQLHRRAGQRRAACATATPMRYFPIGAQGRRARPAAGGRGPATAAPCRAAPRRAARASPAPSSSTCGLVEV